MAPVKDLKSWVALDRMRQKEKVEPTPYAVALM